MTELQLELFDFNVEQVTQPPAPEPKPKAKKKKRIHKHEFDLLDALMAPIVTYPSPWQESLPKELLEYRTCGSDDCIN